MPRSSDHLSEHICLSRLALSIWSYHMDLSDHKETLWQKGKKAKRKKGKKAVLAENRNAVYDKRAKGQKVNSGGISNF